MKVKIVVPFYPINIKGKEDYFKICADASKGDIFPTKDKTFFEILKVIKNKKIHAHGRGFPFPEICSLFASKSVYTPHFNTTGHKKWTKFVRRVIFNMYDYVIAETEFGEKSLIKDGVKKNKIMTIPIPVDFKFFSKKTSGRKFRVKYGIGKKEEFALLVGSRPLKNPHIVSKACKKAGIRLVITGQKKISEIEHGFEWLLPPKEVLEDSDIIFTGFLSKHELRSAYNAATIFVNSSQYESFCLAAYEAASAGLPLCLPKIGTFGVFGKSALFHRKNDASELAKNMLRYINNKKIRDKNSKKSKEIASMFDYDKIKPMYKDFYRKIGFI